MSIVQELLNITEDFYEEINKPSSKNERDQVISKIKEFLAKREVFIKSLTGSYSDEEKLLGEQILFYDSRIKKRFNELMQEIREDILTVKNQKRNTPKYINPYKSIFVNGVFYDKKK